MVGSAALGPADTFEGMTAKLLAGSATFVVGLLLWLFAGDVEIPVFTLTKVGVVLMVVGALEICYGWYSGLSRGDTHGTGDR
ncbi:hypothetical protein Apa02nite_047340 [Actinoplanes palleronii]|uniref:Uncharacterized protein n=2 Tax=Actinoplanes palleronii TaxID=113570 RepID=A0ABQ4BD65_9ACTN|nr:hypothetical protein Apa02nite_047340 [Actinoplanes palleronii]